MPDSVPLLPNQDWRQQLSVQLDTRRAQGLWRAPKLAGNDWVDFSSNDYLGLSQHPQVIAAYQRGLTEFGAGSGGSPLISGYQKPHQRLHDALAEWLGRERVLLTSSGYAANYAVAAALSLLETEQGKPQYYFDKRNHASMYDAIESTTGLVRPGLIRFRHNDVQHLRQLVQQQARSSVVPAVRVIASEGVFSMDGDAAPLARLVEVKQQTPNSILWLDDAHGVGVTGDHGAGVCGMDSGDGVDIVSATFGKAFGLGGAFVAASAPVIEAAWQQARHYIYSTAFSGAQAEAIYAALQCIQQQPTLRQQLDENVAYLKAGLAALEWRTEAQNLDYPHAIQPIVVGDINQALALATHLQAKGIHCVAIRPPTVPMAQAGIRVTIRANHSVADIDRLLGALGTAAHWRAEA